MICIPHGQEYSDKLILIFQLLHKGTDERLSQIGLKEWTVCCSGLWSLLLLGLCNYVPLLVVPWDKLLICLFQMFSCRLSRTCKGQNGSLGIYKKTASTLTCNTNLTPPRCNFVLEASPNIETVLDPVIQPFGNKF